MPLCVRPVRSAEELELYRGLIAQIFPGQSNAPGNFRRGGRLDYLAYLHDAPVGVGSIQYGDLQDHGDTEIFNIGVSPDHRNAGYGRRILMHLCAAASRCRPQQDRIIFPHAVNAGFYQIFGFESEGPAPSDDGEPRLRMRQPAHGAQQGQQGQQGVRQSSLQSIA